MTLPPLPQQRWRLRRVARGVATLLLVLWAIDIVVAAATPDVSFIVTPSPVPMFTYYTDQKMRSHAAAIVTRSVGTTTFTWMPTTRGVRSLFDAEAYLTPAGDEVAALSIAPDPGNPLWARWRYAVVTNLTLTLRGRLPAEVAALRPDVQLTCRPDASVLCESVVPVRALADGQASRVVKNATTVIVDLDRRHGVLPPKLFHVLTNGKYVRGPARASNQSQALNAHAAHTSCVHLEGTGIRVCEDDVMRYFVPSTNASDAIVLGSSFWRTHYAATVIDGYTGEVRAFAINEPPLVLSVMATLAAFLTLIVVYGRWSTGHDTPSVAAVAAYEFFVPLRDGVRRKARASMLWPIDRRIVLGQILLAVAVACGISFCWDGLARAGSSGVGVLQGDAPQTRTLAIALTVYVAVQFTTGIVLAVLYDVVKRRRDRRRLRYVWETHLVPVEVAILRHLAHGTAAAASAALSYYPLAVTGGVGGDRVFLYILLVPLLVTLFHHAYYVTQLLGTVAVLVHWRARPNIHRHRARHLVILGATCLQVALLAAYAGVLLYTFVAPLVGLTSAMFGEEANYVAAVLFVSLVALAGPVMALAELTAALRRRTRVLVEGVKKRA